MEAPSVINEAYDPKRNIQYEVIAYRKLSDGELEQAIRIGLSMMKKKPKNNSTCRMVTLFGLHD